MGDLQHIPFEALLTKEQPDAYLLKETEVSYAYSLSFLTHNKSISRTAKGDFVGFASGVFNYDELDSLTIAPQEVKTIEDIIGGNIYTYDEATKSTFLEELNNYKIIHLATHASAGSDPWIGFVDDKVNLIELYTTNNQGELVVLSACKTSLGEIAQGEGVFSLARAFFYSGANSVVSSLWSVNDKSTSYIMEDFYKNLKKGQTKSEALHHAKRNYINAHALPETSPYYWSPFVLVGDADIQLFKSNNDLIIITSVLLLLLLVSIYYYYRWKKRA